MDENIDKAQDLALKRIRRVWRVRDSNDVRDVGGR